MSRWIMPSVWAECVGDLDGQRQHHLHLQRSSCYPVLQSRPVQELHGDECLTILFADVMNGANIGVIQRGCGLGFTWKAGESLCISVNILRQKLESDHTMETGVLGPVHHTHPTSTELFKDAVMRNGLADHGIGPC